MSALSDEQVFSFLERKTIFDSCQACENYLRRVADGQESPRVFHLFVSKLLGKIFGTDSSRGWIETFSSQKEVEAIFILLNPHGIFCKAISRHTQDAQLQYEIPLSKLPRKIQILWTSSESASISPFYLNHLREKDNASTINSPSANFGFHLNMWEYFLFYFVYYVSTRKDSASGRISFDWSRRQFLEDHKENLSLFNPVLFSSTPHSHPNFSSLTHLTSATLHHSIMTIDTSQLLYEIFRELLEFILPSKKEGYFSARQQSPNACTPSSTPHRMATRAATMIHLAGSTKSTKESFLETLYSSRYYEKCLSKDMSIQIAHYFIHLILELWVDIPWQSTESRSDFEFPSFDVVACILLFVNQLQLLSAPEEGLRDPIHLSIIKLCDIRPTLFKFMSTSLVSCPLDNVYSLLVELWLSILQPWKATPLILNSRPIDIFRLHDGSSSLQRLYDISWKTWGLDYFFFYTHLLQLFLGRTKQFDLISSMNDVRIIERTLSVFDNNITLVSFLIECEKAFVSHYSSSRRISLVIQDGGPTNFSAESVSATLHRIWSLLDDGVYTPIFVDSENSVVRDLARSIHESLEVMNESERRSHMEPSIKLNLKQNFSLLKSICEQLPHIFPMVSTNLNTERLDSRTLGALMSRWLDGGKLLLQPDTIDSKSNLLSPQGREQIKCGKRKCVNVDVNLNGDGTRIVHSYESEWLVALMEMTSNALSSMYDNMVEKIEDKIGFSVPFIFRKRQFSLRLFAAYPNLLFIIILCIFYKGIRYALK